MIYISRSTDADCIPLYTNASVKAEDGETKITRFERERAAAIDFFSNEENYFNNEKLVKDTFGFKVYKDKKLANVLAKDFRSKCAYCESRFGAVSSADIEHYRPKASIEFGSSELKPGYYWLAGNWENLLISCQNCNRVRNHTVPGQSANVLLGKGSQFPLADESKRIRKHDENMSDEDNCRLLLHPCIDRPAEHLIFDEKGLIRAVINGTESPQGKTSIDAYALQRKDLVEARHAEINELRSKVDDLQRLVRQHNHYSTMDNIPHIIKVENLDHIRKVIFSIKSMMLPGAIYIAAKRDWLKAANERGEFDTLRIFGIALETLTLIPT